MKFLQGVWKFVNSKVFGYIFIGILVLLFIGTCGVNSNLKEETRIKDQNISALSDSITTVVLKNGKIQSERDAFMADAKELEGINSDLSHEVKAQKGKVVTLNRIVFQLVQDTTELRKWIAANMTPPKPPTQVNDSTWDIPWIAKYVYDSTNYDAYGGTTQIGLQGPFDLRKVMVFHNGTELTYRNSQIGLTWGQKWEGTGKNKRLRVYAQTAHPAFQTKLLEGTYVDYPEKKHWFTGFGIGPQFDIGYDFLHNQPAIVIGIGIQYNVYQW